MAWPTSTIDTSSMDAGTDSPAAARAEIKKMADNANAIKDAKGASLGVAELDAGGKVPVAQLPVIPAGKGGTGIVSFTIGDLLYASGAATLTRLAAGTAGMVLKSNGPGAAPSWQADGAFPSGTRMIFQQTTPPTGWVKETNSAYNDIALRVVTGSVSSGGAHVFSNVFTGSKSTDAFTLSAAHMPAHQHGHKRAVTGSGNGLGGSAPFINVNADAVTEIQGGGGSHSHGISNFNLKYSDVVIGVKS